MYQALYRQWRPLTFSDMVGQDVVRKTLLSQVRNGRIGHAYLFCGSRGTGKTSSAKILARAVNCLNPQNGDPCGECENCRTILADASLDVVEMDAASNSRVEEMRDLLEKVVYPPQFGKYKVYIIDEVHMLSTAAFNALLKTLEEPPSYMVFIFATTEPQKIPATILSRCQRFDFGRLSEEQIAGRLRQAADAGGMEAEDSALYLIAQAAEGGMRDAFSIMDMCAGTGERITDETVRRVLGAADKRSLFELSDAIFRDDSARALAVTREVMRQGRDLAVLVRDLSQHLRSVLICKLCTPDAAVLNTTPETVSLYAEQAGHVSREKLLRVLYDLMRTESDLRWTSSPRGAVENAILRACASPDEADVGALSERIAELERQLMDREQLLRRIERLEQGIVSAPAVRTEPARPGGAPDAAEAAEASGTPETQPQPAADEASVCKKATEILSRTNPMLFGSVKHGKLRPQGEHAYVLEFSDKKEDEVHFTLSSRPAQLAALEEALRQAGDSEATVEVRKNGPVKNDDREKMIRRNEQLLFDTFGRENVILDDNV